MVPGEDKKDKASSHVNWNILKPIMAYFHGQSTLMVKGPDKAYGQNDVTNGI